MLLYVCENVKLACTRMNDSVFGFFLRVKVGKSDVCHNNEIQIYNNTTVLYEYYFVFHVLCYIYGL